MFPDLEHYMNNYMNHSLLRILFVFFTSFVLIDYTLDAVFADEQEITSRIFSFENTAIIEFTNTGLAEIKTIKIWLIDSSFISFKLENNWTSPIASPDRDKLRETIIWNI